MAVFTDKPLGYVTKGSRIHAEWFGDGKFVPLAGAQLKAQVTKFEVVGVVRHVRGDRPVDPTEVRFYIDPESEWTGSTVDLECSCGHPHVEIKPAWVRAVE
jgi:hypothetical protein